MMIEIKHENKSPKNILLLNDPYKKQSIVKQVPNPTNLVTNKIDERGNMKEKYTSHKLLNTNKRIYHNYLDNSTSKQPK